MTHFPAGRMVTLVYCLVVSAIFWSARVSAKTVNFAYNTPTLSGTLPIVVAQDFGFFAAEGLEVNTVFTRGSPTAMLSEVNLAEAIAFVCSDRADHMNGKRLPLFP